MIIIFIGLALNRYLRAVLTFGADGYGGTDAHFISFLFAIVQQLRLKILY